MARPKKKVVSELENNEINFQPKIKKVKLKKAKKPLKKFAKFQGVENAN